MTTQTTLTAENIDTAIRTAFPFSVDKFALSGPDNMPSPHFGLFRSDNGACVGRAVTKIYNPHTVDDVCALAQAAATAFDGAGQVRAFWNDGHFVTVSPTDASQRAAYDKRNPQNPDVYVPRMIIKAGYDGRAFEATFGIYRLVCRNLMAIPVKGKTVRGSIRHSGMLNSRISDLVEDFRSVVDHGSSIADTIDRANSRTVNMKDFIQSVYPLPEKATDRIVKGYQDRLGEIMTRLYTERNALGLPSDDCTTATAWEAFNAVQGYVQHDSRRNGQISVTERAVLALESPAVAKAAALAFA